MQVLQKAIVLLLFLPFTLFAQLPFNVDSLHKALKFAKDERVMADILNNLSISYIRKDLNKAIAYNKQAMDLAVKVGEKKEIAAAYFDLWRKGFDFSGGRCGKSGESRGIGTDFQE